MGLSRLLRTAGYEVRTYASAVDFLLNKSRNPQGCVVFEVRMLAPSGFDLQDTLVKLDEPLPIIFVKPERHSDECSLDEKWRS